MGELKEQLNVQNHDRCGAALPPKAGIRKRRFLSQNRDLPVNTANRTSVRRFWEQVPLSAEAFSGATFALFASLTPALRPRAT